MRLDRLAALGGMTVRYVTKEEPNVAKITFPIEASHILMFARAIGDDNPVYHDAEKAKHSEVGGIIAPPTFTAAVAQFR